MTRSAHPVSLTKPLGLCAALLALTVPALVQSQEAEAPAAAPSEPKVIPTIRTNIYDRINEAQICLDEGDLECAIRVLDRFENIRDLNNYEVANYWNYRAFVAFEQDDTQAAIDAYVEILAIPHSDIPDGMISATMRNLAMLYIQVEDYRNGLARFEEYLALPYVEPNEDDYVLLAQVHYSLEDYAAGIPAIQQAIQMANDSGELGDEGWYQLLYVFYFELEQTDNVISTLEFLVENWPKRDWMLQLAGQLSDQERPRDTLSLYEAAFEAGFLERGEERVQLASLLLDAQIPYKAGVILQEGLDSGEIESTEQNWRLLAQAWQIAREDEDALPALIRSASLADDGQIDSMLAQSYARLARWDECADSARAALDRGGLDRTDYTYLQLGQCLFNAKRYSEARTAFEAAAQDDRRAADARSWIRYVNNQVEAERQRAEAEALIASVNAEQN